MSGIGELLLKLRGATDPKAALISSLLGGGGQRGGAPVPAAPGAASGVRTPAGLPGAAATGAPAAPAQPPHSPLYDSPPDLVGLYNQLTDYQSREKRVDTGLGLLAGAVVQPRNAGLVSSMFGGDQNAVDPFTLITQVQALKQQQQDRATKQATYDRMKASIPAIAKQYGLDEQTAQLLLDNGELDQYILQASKPQDLPTSVKEYDFAVKQGYKGPYDQWSTEDANRKRPTTNVTTNVDTTGAKALLGALDKNLTDPLAALPDSNASISAVQNGRKALGDGVIAGSIASPATLEGRKLFASAFGLSDAAANNSDEFIDAMKTQVLPKLKTLYPASDTDVKYLEGMTAATLTQHPEVLNRVIDKIEIGERKKIADTNAKMQKRIDSETDPVVKAQLQSAFDAQKVEPPAYDPVYMSHINPDDAKAIKADPTPDNIKEFDALYGPGAAEQLLGTP